MFEGVLDETLKRTFVGPLRVLSFHVVYIDRSALDL